jgi:hypothetical protein
MVCAAELRALLNFGRPIPAHARQVMDFFCERKACARQLTAIEVAVDGIGTCVVGVGQVGDPLTTL